MVERRAGPLEVGPAEAGERDRQEVESPGAAPEQVGLPHRGGVARGFGRRAVATDRPRRDHIGQLQHLVQRRIGNRVAGLRAPETGHTEHNREAAGVRIVLEEGEDLPPIVERGTGAVVQEAAAPEGEEGFAAVVQIRGVAREGGFAHQSAPVGDEEVGLAGREAAEVVHEGVGPAVHARAFAAVGEHGVVVPERVCVAERVDEALHEHAVDAVFAHPLEVAQHRGAEIGAENLGRAAVGVDEVGREPFVGAVVGEVGPEIHIDAAGAGPSPAGGPVIVPPVCAVALAVEPTLVAAHDLAGQARRIHGG